jgi:acyl carrier protein
MKNLNYLLAVPCLLLSLSVNAKENPQVSKANLEINKSLNGAKSKASLETIEERVRQVIVEKLGIDPIEVTLEASLMDDLGADWLDMIELTMAYEEEFQISIPDEDEELLLTVGAVVDYIRSHV